jgi:hypothetical protein
MLRLAVAVKNCFKAEGIGCWDIWAAQIDQAGRDGRSRQSARAGKGRQRGLANSVIALCGAAWERWAVPSPGRAESAIFALDRLKSRTNRRLFRLYRTGRAGVMMPRRRRVCLHTFEGWSAPMDSSQLAQHAGTAGTLFASVFLVATTTMRTMIPLRLFSILTNLVLIATAIPSHNYLLMLVQTVVLVLNSYRLHQMLQLVQDVKRSVSGDLSMEWLKPFMTERKCNAGEMLFYKGEKAEDMLYIVSGRFRLVESGIELPVGAIVGELGMLSPSKVRTQSLECIDAGMILSMSYAQVEQLCVQNPAFGFYFLRLSSARLFQNIDTLEQRLAQQTALLAAKTA